MEVSEEEGSAPERDEAAARWVKPEIASFEPIKASEGISYNPTDGLANLTT